MNYLSLLVSLLGFPLLVIPMFARQPGCEGGDEGRHGSALARGRLRWGSSVGGSPVKSYTVHAFSIFAYSSKTVQANFERMDSMFACGILKNSKFLCRSCSFSERAPAMKLTCFTSHPLGRSVLSSADFMDAYIAPLLFVLKCTPDTVTFSLHGTYFVSNSCMHDCCSMVFAISTGITKTG
jgi:hypothetical protein